MVGRATDLRRIETLLERALREGGALTLSGGAGVGKTMLLDATAERVAASGVRVVRMTGVQFEAEMSFSGLHQLAALLPDDLAGLERAPREALTVALGLGSGTPPGRLQVSNAALALVRAAAHPAPLLVIVDDVPWIDRASAEVLAFVARRLAGSRAGLVASCRSGVASFFDPAGLASVELQALGREDSAELLRASFPEMPEAVCHRLISDGEGNPLAMLELAQALGEPRRAGRQALPPVLPLTDRLRSLFSSRVQVLPQETRALLLVAVLEGTGDIGALGERDGSAPWPAGGEWPAALAPAERARLVRADASGQRIVFRHPLTRSAVFEHATAEERRAAHLALSGRFPRCPERTAWHLAEAGVPASEEVARVLEQSADANLRRGDAMGAVGMLTKAADLTPWGPERSRRLARAAYVGADLAGELRSLSPRLETARGADLDRTGSLQASVATAYTLLNGDGDLGAAHRLLTRAIETWAGTEDEAASVEAIQTLFDICLWSRRPEHWDGFREALAVLDLELPAYLALQIQLIGDPVHAVTPAVLERLDAEIASIGDEVDVVRIDRVIRAAVYADRIADCRPALEALVADARRGGAVTPGINALTHLSLDGFARGRWDEAEQLAGDGLALAGERGFDLFCWSFRQVLALLAAARGDQQRAHALTDEMLRWAIPREVGAVEAFARHGRELAALTRGDYEYAYDQVVRIGPPGVFAAGVAYSLRVPLDLVEAAVRTGRNEAAIAHVRAIEREQIASISPRLSLLAAASAAVAADRADEANEHFERALAVPERTRWPFDHARVELLFGERLRRAGDRMRSRGHLTTAYDTFTALGALPWAMRAANELAATGERVRRRTDERRDALTERESQIARLAAEGLSNRLIGEQLFISPRTVGYHLGKVFTKLDVANRAQLHRALD